MNTPTGTIRLISAAPGESLWHAVLARVAATAQDRAWDLPGWLLPDERHRRAAENDLLERLDRRGIPTQTIFTFQSLCAELLASSGALREASASTAALTLSALLREDCPPEYQASADKPGFTAGFWQALLEVESRGHFPGDPARYGLADAQGPAPPPAFSQLQLRLHDALARRGWCTPGALLRDAWLRLRDAADVPLPQPLFIGPLGQCGLLERRLIGALAQRSSDTYLAPAPGWNLRELLPPDFPEDRIADASPSPSFPPVVLIRSATPEAELDAAFAIIAQWVAQGQFRYRDVRLAHPFAAEELPRLCAAAQRYHAPLRTDVRRPLESFPGVALIRKILQLFASRWNRQDLLDLCRSRLFDSARMVECQERSAFIAGVLEKPDPRARPPWTGWLSFSTPGDWMDRCLTRLAQLDEAAGEKPITGRQFAQWLSNIAAWVRESGITGDALEFVADPGESEAWKTFNELLETLSGAHSKPLQRGEWIAEFERGAHLCTYASRDSRADAVELSSGTRDDHLPVAAVIYLGLSSRVPASGRYDPFLQAESGAGYAEKRAQFLCQISNARSRLVLSCPRFSDDGDETALSSFLASPPFKAEDGSTMLHQAEAWLPYCETALRAPTADPAFQGAPCLLQPQSRRFLKDKAIHWSVSRLNHAVQCLYLHFAADRLKLQPAADAQASAITPGILGILAHDVLRDYLRAGLQGKTVDIRVTARDRFAREMQKHEPHPESDRSSAELIRCLSDFAARGWTQFAPGFSPRLPFSGAEALEIPFNDRDAALPALEILLPSAAARLEGMMDRLDVGAAGEALVIEYKYQKVNGERSQFAERIRSGVDTQLPFYALAARRLLRLNPVALLQIYLRSGFVLGLRLPQAPPLQIGAKEGAIEDIAPSDMEAILQAAQATLEAKTRDLLAGVISTDPRDFSACGAGACEYFDLCRFRGLA